MGKKKEEAYSKDVVKMIRAIDEKFKSKPDEQGKYHLKNSEDHKKTRRAIRVMCPHWRLDNNEVPQPTIETIPGRPGVGRCRRCGAEFPIVIKTIDPAFPEETPYKKEIEEFEKAVHTVEFYAVKHSSGKIDDFGVLTALRKGIKEFRKISYAVSYAFTKEKQFADRSVNAASDFSAYSNAGFTFR